MRGCVCVSVWMEHCDALPRLISAVSAWYSPSRAHAVVHGGLWGMCVCEHGSSGLNAGPLDLNQVRINERLVEWVTHILAGVLGYREHLVPSCSANTVHLPIARSNLPAPPRQRRVELRVCRLGLLGATRGVSQSLASTSRQVLGARRLGLRQSASTSLQEAAALRLGGDRAHAPACAAKCGAAGRLAGALGIRRRACSAAACVMQLLDRARALVLVRLQQGMVEADDDRLSWLIEVGGGGNPVGEEIGPCSEKLDVRVGVAHRPARDVDPVAGVE